MADSTSTPEGFSLKRWSRRKLEAARAETPELVPAAVPPATVAPVPAVVATTAPDTPDATTPEAHDGAAALPPIESLTQDSDFSAFMQPKVDEALKRAALKKLFTDPHFNVMDGLDIYVGDYTQADPMPEGMLEKLGKVYGMAKEAVADTEAAPDGASIIQADADAPEVASAEATATEEHPPPPATSDPGVSPALPGPEAQATLPLLAPESPAVTASPAVPEGAR